MHTIEGIERATKSINKRHLTYCEIWCRLRFGPDNVTRRRIGLDVKDPNHEGKTIKFRFAGSSPNAFSYVRQFYTWLKNAHPEVDLSVTDQSVRKQAKAERHATKKPKPRRYKIVYRDYIDSNEWKRKADNCKRKANYKCEVCESCEFLQTHHYNYYSLGYEESWDLFCLCGTCHEAYHHMVKELPKDNFTRRERLASITSSVRFYFERTQNQKDFLRRAFE